MVALNLFLLFVYVLEVFVNSVHAGDPKKLLIAGGEAVGMTMVNDTELITLNSGSREILQDYPNPTEGAVGTWIDENNVIVCGGFSSYDQCFEFNLLTKANWTESSSKFSRPRAYIQGVEIGSNSILISGGFALPVAQYGTTEETEIYNRTDKTFYSGPNLPEKMSSYCVSRINDTHIFFSGGYASSTAFNPKCYILNIENGEFTNAKDLNFGRHGHACAMYKDKNGKEKIVAAGGYIPGWQVSDSTEVYDVATDTWTALSESMLPFNLTYGTTTPSGFLVGGFNEVEYFDTIMKFNSNSEKFEKLDQRLSKPRKDPAVVEVFE